jgi:predicted nucleic acid-binding protein
MKRARDRAVLDASAAAAVLFREPGFGDVLRVLPSRGGLVAPPLLSLEVANVAREKVRRGEVGRADAEVLLAELDRWRVRRVDVRARDAWDVAWTHGLTLYDAAYLQLALARRLPIVTLDRELRRAAGARARP